MKITCKTPPVEVGNSQRDLRYSKTDEQSCGLSVLLLAQVAAHSSPGRTMSDIHEVRGRASEGQGGLKIQVCPSLAAIWDKTQKIPEPQLRLPGNRDRITYSLDLMETLKESIISSSPSSLGKPPGNLGLSQQDCRITE